MTTRSGSSTARIEACRAVSKDAPKLVDELCGPCREHFDAVQSGLREEGVAFRLEPTLVRGLDYYTRTAFEFVSGALHEAQATFCGGGRYDGLAEVLGGPPTPGVGFGMGLDRVLLAMRGGGYRDGDRAAAGRLRRRDRRRRASLGVAGGPGPARGRGPDGRRVRDPSPQSAASDGRPGRGAVRGDHRRAGGRGAVDGGQAPRRRPPDDDDRRGARRRGARARPGPGA